MSAVCGPRRTEWQDLDHTEPRKVRILRKLIIVPFFLVLFFIGILIDSIIDRECYYVLPIYNVH